VSRWDERAIGVWYNPAKEEVPWLSAIRFGIDLGDRHSHCCVLGPDGVVFAEGRRADHTGHDGEPFRECASGLITIEVEMHSRRVSQLFQDWGHEVVVAKPRNLPMITANIRKSDRTDAHLLARLGRVDRQLLSPAAYRGENPGFMFH
jgi:transposase